MKQTSECLALLERSDRMDDEMRALKQSLTEALTDALSKLMPPGTIIKKRWRMESPTLNNCLRAIAGADRGARQFEIAGPIAVDFDAGHPDLSKWRADAYPINDKGKRMSGRAGNSRFGEPKDTVPITAYIVSLDHLDPLTMADVHKALAEVINAAQQRATTETTP